MSGEEKTAEDTLSLGKHPKFLCGVAVSVYQNSGGVPCLPIFYGSELGSESIKGSITDVQTLPPVESAHG